MIAYQDMTALCSCRQVELKVRGAPIATNVCYCEDCQAGADRIERLPHARPVRDADGGTAYVLFRKDRVVCTKGATFLKCYKIAENSATNRVVASCCNSAMFMSFDRGPHWISLYRQQLQGTLPDLQMRVFTKYRLGGMALPDDILSYRGIPLRLAAQLLFSRVAMLLHL